MFIVEAALFPSSVRSDIYESDAAPDGAGGHESPQTINIALLTERGNLFSLQYGKRVKNARPTNPQNKYFNAN